MSARGGDPPFWATEDRFPTMASTPPSVKGRAIRAARHEVGMTASAAARCLQIPAPTLVQVELGELVFTEPADYARVMHNIRTGAARAAKERGE